GSNSLARSDLGPRSDAFLSGSGHIAFRIRQTGRGRVLPSDGQLTDWRSTGGPGIVQWRHGAAVRWSGWLAHQELWLVSDLELVLRLVAQSHEMLVTRFKRAYRFCDSTETEPGVVRGLAQHKDGTAGNCRLEQCLVSDPASEATALMLGMNGQWRQVKPNRPPISIGPRITDVGQQITFGLYEPLIGWTRVTCQRTNQARLELARRKSQIQELYDCLKCG